MICPEDDVFCEAAVLAHPPHPERVAVTRVLAAGDLFIRSALFREAIRAALPNEPIDVAELDLPWPDVPFGAVAEVDEASGSEEGIIEALAGADAVVTQLAPLTRRVIDASPDLRFIGVSRGGPTNINVAAACERGILVTNVPGRNGIATAEMTIGLALAALRRIPSSHDTLMAGVWRGDLYRHDTVGSEVAGATVGLLGAGAVGAHVARVFQAMGAKVIVFDPFLAPDALDGVAERVDRVEEVFVRSDIISVHARLADDTRHMVDGERLALVRRGGLLVNAARGGLVDYDAVADAIESGVLGGAAFDVFPEEPVDFTHRIFALAKAGHNLVMTPHIAGASTQTAERAARGVAEELRRFLDGEEPLNPLR